MTKLVIGLFDRRSEASLTLARLRDKGIKSGQMSVVAKRVKELAEIGRDFGLGEPKAGIGDNGLFGTAKGLAIGLGLRPERAAVLGKAAPRLAGAALGEEDGEDGMAVGLIGIGLPREDALSYSQAVAGGKLLVIVETESDRAEEVRTEMNRTGERI